MSRTILLLILAAFAAACSKPAEDMQEHPAVQERHEAMESVGDAAKVLGGMLKRETDYDWVAAETALTTWSDVAAKFGDLFPEGSENGAETEAAPAIWTERAGFDESLAKWADDTAAALAAAPATIEDAEPLLGAAFKNCKGCHDNYRIDKE